MPSHSGNRRPAGVDTQLSVAVAHLESIKDVALSVGESGGVWTASAAKALAGYIQEHTEAALDALKQARPTS